MIRVEFYSKLLRLTGPDIRKEKKLAKKGKKSE